MIKVYDWKVGHLACVATHMSQLVTFQPDCTCAEQDYGLDLAFKKVVTG